MFHVGTYDVLKSNFAWEYLYRHVNCVIWWYGNFPIYTKIFSTKFQKVKRDLKTTFVHKFEHFYTQTMKQNHIQANFPHQSF